MGLRTDIECLRVVAEGDVLCEDTNQALRNIAGKLDELDRALLPPAVDGLKELLEEARDVYGETDRLGVVARLADTLDAMMAS